MDKAEILTTAISISGITNDTTRYQRTIAALTAAYNQGWDEAVEEVAQHADTDELAAEIRRKGQGV